jgi:hypothetical protein
MNDIKLPKPQYSTQSPIIRPTSRLSTLPTLPASTKATAKRPENSKHEQSLPSRQTRAMTKRRKLSDDTWEDIQEFEKGLVERVVS